MWHFVVDLKCIMNYFNFWSSRKLCFWTIKRWKSCLKFMKMSNNDAFFVLILMFYMSLSQYYIKNYLNIIHSSYASISGMPVDLYNIWFPSAFPFSEIVCILQGLFSETSTNASILTIFSFTCERYIAICHPFRWENKM